MIGYISVEVDGEKHTGGVIVVDERGIPLEFKYTEPVQPTQLQRIVYGKSLEDYLHVEIIAKSLLSDVENKPGVFLTDDVKLIEAGEGIFYITRTVDDTVAGEGEYVISTPGMKYRLFGNGSISEEVLNELEGFAEHSDILEPFQRLHRALVYVCSNM